MSSITIAILGIIVMLVLMFLGMNLGMAMMGTGFVGFWILKNFKAAVGVIASVPTSQVSTYALTVVPLFVMMGNFAFSSGISTGLYSFGNKWLSWLPGGLSCATIAGCAAFGAICGSTPATTATMGVVAVPEMRKYGYDDTISAGAVSFGGTLGIMIPPSTAFIVYGLLAEESIGRLFVAGIIPGIIEAIIAIVIIVILVKLKPSLAPPSQSFTWKERFVAFKDILSMLILFGLVFGGMFTGITTINESAAVGAFAGLIIMILHDRKFDFKKFIRIMFDSLKSAAMVYLILTGAMVFGSFLTLSKLPMTLAAVVQGLNVSRWVVMAVMLVIYAFLGCLIDSLPMITLTLPIFLPIATRLGFDPIWFGVVIVVVMQMALITPPVGMSCYVFNGIFRDIPLSTVFKGSMPFAVTYLITILLICFFPILATWLPTVFYGI